MQKSIKNSKKFVYYNENMNNFKRNYLENYDSEHAAKTKHAPFFMNFLNIHKTQVFFRLY